MNVNELVHLVLIVQQQPDYHHPPAGGSPDANMICKGPLSVEHRNELAVSRQTEPQSICCPNLIAAKFFSCKSSLLWPGSQCAVDLGSETMLRLTRNVGEVQKLLYIP